MDKTRKVDMNRSLIDSNFIEKMVKTSNFDSNSIEKHMLFDRVARKTDRLVRKHDRVAINFDRVASKFIEVVGKHDRVDDKTDRVASNLDRVACNFIEVVGNHDRVVGKTDRVAINHDRVAINFCLSFNKTCVCKQKIRIFKICLSIMLKNSRVNRRQTTVYSLLSIRDMPGSRKPADYRRQTSSET